MMYTALCVPALLTPSVRNSGLAGSTETGRAASTVESPAEMPMAHVSKARGSESAMRFMVAYNVL